MAFEKFSCHICSRSTDTRGKLNKHLKTHTKPFRCGTCQKGFALRLDLDRHVKSQHRAGNERYCCNVERCVFTSSRKDNLRRHQTKAHGRNFKGCPDLKSDETKLPHQKPDIISATEMYGVYNFMQVAASGDLQTLKIFLGAGLKVETKADDLSTVLHCAARTGQAEIVRYLLEIGANVEARNDKSRLPIHEAVLSNSFETVETFLEQIPRERLLTMAQELEGHLIRSGSIKIVDAYIKRLGQDFANRLVSKKLYFAVRTGHVKLMATLLDDPDVDANHPCTSSYAPIHVAASFGRTAIMESLIACNRINKSLCASESRQALHMAASKGHTAIVQQLLHHPSVDVNCQNRYADTPLHCASTNGHAMVVEQLIRHPSFDVNPRNGDEDTPLHCASSQGHTAVVKQLIRHPNVEVNCQTWGTPLHYASANGRTMVVAQLIDHPSVDVNCRDKDEATPLHHAVFNWHWETASLLLRHLDAMSDGHGILSDVSPLSLTFTKEDLLDRIFKHSDFGSPNKLPPGKDKTILSVATEKGDCEVIEVLLAYPDIDVNKTDDEDLSPLMTAARYGKLEAARLLLQHKGIDVNKKGTKYWGYTALEHAKQHKYYEIVDLLLSHGAIDYDAKASTTVPIAAQIDNPPNITLQPYHESNLDPVDDDMDDVPSEAWEDFLDMEEVVEE